MAHLSIKKQHAMNFFKKTPAILLASMLCFLIIFLPGCTGVQKYTYEEYKKLKALSEKDTGKSDSSLKPAQVDKNDTGMLNDANSIYAELDAYNNYLKEFNQVYNKYAGPLLLLFEDFDNEQQDLENKNEYAFLIIQQQREWLNDMHGMQVPDIMTQYHNYFSQYLEKEILFYESFTEGKQELSVQYQLEATQLYEKAREELLKVEEGFGLE